MAEITVLDGDSVRTEVTLSGRLDLAGVQQVEMKFSTLVGSRRKPTLVDLSGVDFIASLGIGMLTAAAKGLAAHGHTMVLVTSTGMVDATLRAASIDRVIPMAADRDAALALL